MKPVLLLIPGMFNTGAIWDAVTPHLQDRADVRIANVLQQDSMDAMAEDAWAQVADVPPGTPRVVCGFSMGGYVAIELLARQPDRFQGLGLIDSAGGIETSESLVLREKTISALERNFERTVEGIIPFSLHPNSHANRQITDGMRRMMHEVGAHAAIRQTRALMKRRDHRSLLAGLKMPVLIACGREDRVTPPTLSQELADLIPGSQLAWIEAAGHQTPLEQAPTLARLILELVDAASTST
jgi:pimeloyl-ACP methyl ester carboxylesterase